jgi:predicted Ser/Thr protein kinase
MVHHDSHNPTHSVSLPAPSPDGLAALLALPEDELLQRGRLLHAAGSVANADVYLLAEGSSPVVLKTFRRRPWLVRVCFSRWTLAHEVAVLRCLDGVPGVPLVWGRAGRDSFLMEYIAGAGPLRNSREIAAAEFPGRPFFTRLRDLVDAMHARGVSHGDLRRLNVMRGPGDVPYLIDFATALSAQGFLAALRRRVVALVARADLFAVAKLIASYYPDLLTDAERDRLANLPWYLRAGRFIRKRVYGRFIKQKHWRQRWARWRQGSRR